MAIEQHQDPVRNGQPALYTFAAKGIQNFIFSTNELKDIVGATEIVDRLPRETLDKTIAALGLARFEPLSRAAGQARLLFERRQDAEKLTAAWPMVCRYVAPGLEIVQAVVSYDGAHMDAVREAERLLATSRNQPPADHPQIPPIARRVSKTGLVAVPVPREFGVEERDEAGRAKLAAREQRHRPDASALPENDIRRQIGFERVEEAPETFDDISGGEREYLAIVHADGNGFGELFLGMANALAGRLLPGMKDFHRELSFGIERVTKAAARKAFEPIRGQKAPWPALPIILAGDDLTVVFRADLAFEFTQRYLEAFIEESGSALAELRAKYQEIADALDGAMPQTLTASAGIAFVKRRYPYSAASALVESLTAFAKRGARRARREDGLIPATVAFHRVTASSTNSDFEVILDRELTSLDKATRLSLAPYAVGPVSKLRPLPGFQTLGALAKCLAGLPSGKLREILGQLHVAQAPALRRYARLRELGRQGPQKATLEQCDQLLAALTARADPAVCVLASPDPETNLSGTPLGDALLWAHFLDRDEEEGQRETMVTPAAGP